MSRKGTKPGAAAITGRSNASSFAKREEEALETLGKVPEAPVNGSPDTVKLSSQTWQPPPPKGKLAPQSWKDAQAQATVKVQAQTWKPPSPSHEDEDAVTDVRDVHESLDEDDDPVDEGVVTGEENPQVAGEIGSVDDQPVRIVSVPPADIESAPVKLPGMPTEVTGPPQAATTTNRSPAVPMPKRPPLVETRTPTPPPRATPPRRAPTPPPAVQESSMTPAPAPSPFAETTPLPRRDMTPLPRTDLTPPGREATPIPGRQVDPTMMIRIEKGPTKAIIITALLASGLGLGAGFLLWGRDGGSATQTNEAAAKTADSEVDSEQKPSAVLASTKCHLKLDTTPAGVLVKLGETTIGETPLDREVPCGEAKLTLTKRRFETKTIDADFKPGAVVTHSIEVPRPEFRLTVKSSPAGADVYLGEEKLGKTPAKLTLPGYTKHSLVLKRDGYRDYNANVTLKKRSTTTSYRLRRKR